MKYESFRADVELGGLYNVNEIKILICIILDKTDTPLNIESIAKIITTDALANYFDIVQAISNLLDDNNIIKDENELFTLTTTGKIVAKELSSQVPFTVKEKALEAAKAEILRASRLKDNSVKIIPDNNSYIVKISMLENGRELMGISFRVATFQEADQVKENFLKDPSSIYICNVSRLLGFEVEESEEV